MKTKALIIGGILSLWGMVLQATVTITVSPSDQTVCEGDENVTFTVTATSDHGGGITGYQWKKGADNIGTDPTFVLSTVATTDAGSYSVVVTDADGSVTSATATLTVNAKPTASISYTGSPWCTSAGTKAVSLTGTSGGEFTSTAGLSIDATTGTIAPSTSTAGGYTVTYTIAAAGGCAQVQATTPVAITANMTVGVASSTPTVFINTAISTTITHTTTLATGIGVASDLPLGVNATWASNTISISGTPSESGTFNYTIPLSGGCGSINASGTIYVIEPTIISAAYDASTGFLTITGANLNTSTIIDQTKITISNGTLSRTLSSATLTALPTSSTTALLKIFGADRAYINAILNNDGTSSYTVGTYNIAAATGWNGAGTADLTGNPISVSSFRAPSITSVTYNYTDSTFRVSGAGFAADGENDIDVTKISISGYNNTSKTFAVSDVSNISITSDSIFTFKTLTTEADSAVENILDNNGTISTDSKSFYFNALAGWNTAQQLSLNGDNFNKLISVSNLVSPQILKSFLDVKQRLLTLTGEVAPNNFSLDYPINLNRLVITTPYGTYRFQYTTILNTPNSNVFSVTIDERDIAYINSILIRSPLNESDYTLKAESHFNGPGIDDTAGDNYFNTKTNTNSGYTYSKPIMNSSEYNSNTGELKISGIGFAASIDPLDTTDIDVTQITISGYADGAHTLRTAHTKNPEVKSSLIYSIIISGNDKVIIDSLLNQTGFKSTDNKTYKIIADNSSWNPSSKNTDYNDASTSINVLSAFNNKPTAPSVTITGNINKNVGQTLAGTNTYFDAEGDLEGTSTFKWYKDTTPITDQISKSYTILASDVGSNIYFEVTPVAQTGTQIGTAVKSAAYGPIENSAPTATSVSITGTKAVCSTLTGNYTYNDLENDAQSGSTFKWYRANDAIGTGKTAITSATNADYKLDSADNGKYIQFEVIPKTGAGTQNTIAYTSAWTSIITDPRPTANITAGLAKCTGDSVEVSINLTGVAPWSFTYTDGTTSVTKNSINTNPYKFTSNVTDTFYLTTLTDANNCAASSASRGGTAIATIKPYPSAAGTIDTTTTYICQYTNGTAFSIADLNDEDNYIWTYSGTGATINNGTTRSITLNLASNATSGTLTVKGHNSCGDGPSKSVNITVKPLPANPSFIVGKNSVCHLDSNVLFKIYKCANADSYEWTVPTGYFIQGLATDTVVKIKFLTTAATGSISVRCKNSCNNSLLSSSLGIKVDTLPDLHFDLNPAYNKVVETVPLIGTPSGGIFLGKGVTSDDNTFHPNLAGLGLKTISYTFTDGNGCKNTYKDSTKILDESTELEAKNIYCYNHPIDTIKVITSETITESKLTLKKGLLIINNATKQIDYKTFTLKPDSLSRGSYTLELKYDGTSENTIISKSFVIDSVSVSDVTGIVDKTKYCISDNSPKKLTPSNIQTSYSAGGSHHWTVLPSIALTQTANDATFFPSDNAVHDNYKLNYQFESANGCMSDTIQKNFSIKALPNVEISDSTKTVYNYDQGATPLKGNHTKGEFIGTGIISSGSGYQFNPASAGVNNNILIRYKVKDSLSCENTDTMYFDVLKDTFNIYGVKAGAYCKNSDNKSIIRVFNHFKDDKGDTIIGSFSLKNGGTTGIENLNNNTASFNPSEAKLGSNQLIYSYKYRGVDFSTKKDITIDSIGDVSFTGLDSAYCEKSGIFTLTPKDQYPLGGIVEWDGNVTPQGNNALFSTTQLTGKTYKIGIKYSTANCQSSWNYDSTYINPLPPVKLDSLRSNYNRDLDKSFTLKPDSNYRVGTITFQGNGVLEDSSTYTFTPNSLPPQNYEIRCTYTDTNSCSNTVAKSLTIEYTKAQFNGLKDTYCSNDSSFSFKIDSLLNMDSFKFTGGKGVFDTSKYTAQAHYNPRKFSNNSKDTIVFTYRNASNTLFELRKVITINKVTELSLKSDDTTICQTGQTKISVFPNKGTFEIYSYFENPYFIGSKASIESLNPIRYSLTDDNGCKVDSTIFIKVLKSPTPSFVVNDSCRSDQFPIRFVNKTSDTAGLKIKSILWDFGDRVIDTTYSTQHIYTSAGSKIVQLSMKYNNGCEAATSKKIQVEDKPAVDFTWDDDCFGGASKLVNFTNKSTTATNQFDQHVWYIKQNGTLLDSFARDADNKNLSYSFKGFDDYTVTLKSRNNFLCENSKEVLFQLRPYLKMADSSYNNSFTASKSYWYRDSAITSINNWKYLNNSNKSTDSMKLNSGLWYLTPTKKKEEDSWISGPCMDFTGMNKPMIELKMHMDLEKNHGGVVLQYLDSLQWKSIGTLGDPIAWYNSNKIQSTPGDVIEGWTQPDTMAQKLWSFDARHIVDELVKMKKTRLRLAYGNDGLGESKFVAIDNIWIGERSKNVLFEHFTNNAQAASETSNEQVNSIVNSFQYDIVNLNYHTGSPNNDVFYNAYSAGTKNRSLFYNVKAAPYSIVDGGFSIQNKLKSANTIVNWTSSNWSDAQRNTLIENILSKPKLNIFIDVKKTEQSIALGLSLTALENIVNKPCQLYVVVTEKTVKEGSKTYTNIVRKILPNAAGVTIEGDWTQNTTKNFNFNWTMENISLPDNIEVIAFLQDSKTGEILQVAKNNQLQNGIILSTQLSSYTEFDIYPNPASEQIVITNRSNSFVSGNVFIYNTTGHLVMESDFEKGITAKSINISALKMGVYFVKIVTDRGMQLVKLVKQ